MIDLSLHVHPPTIHNALARLVRPKPFLIQALCRGYKISVLVYIRAFPQAQLKSISQGQAQLPKPKPDSGSSATFFEFNFGLGHLLAFDFNMIQLPTPYTPIRKLQLSVKDLGPDVTRFKMDCCPNLAPISKIVPKNHTSSKLRVDKYKSITVSLQITLQARSISRPPRANGLGKPSNRLAAEKVVLL
ncbi:hypothetical protein B0H11DRAFT_1914704 [Mycena galericulata]|nr:hypothetical protein B0H11DRAFT_1914704 [Mycena galericulata]